jgi:integration host factor subunit beta
MNRSEIVTLLMELYPKLKRKQIDLLVKKLFMNMIDNVANGERIEIRGFGCFSLKVRRGSVRNPRDGVTILADDRSVVYFRAGKELRERVNIAHLNSLNHD